MDQFPKQKLTKAEKISKYGSVQKWGESVADAIDQVTPYNFEGTSFDKYEKKVLADMVEDIIYEADYEHTTRPYGDLIPKNPNAVKNYNRIKNKIRSLLERELARPFNYRAVNINPEAVTSYETKRKEMTIDAYKALMAKEFKKLGVLPQEYATEEPMMPSQIKKYLTTEFQDILEIYANQTLEWCKRYLRLQEKFNKGFNDLLVQGDEIYYIGNSYSEPIIRRVNPLDFCFDMTPGLEYIDEAAWARERRLMSAHKIYDELGEILEDGDIEKIEDMKGGYGSYGMSSYWDAVAPQVRVESVRNDDKMHSTTYVPVFYYTFVGMRKIGKVTYYDNEDVLQERIVDETYKKRKEDTSLEWEWVNETWEAWRIGNLVRGVRPRPNQYKSLDNPNKTRLPYTGVSDLTLSVVRQIKHIQYYFNTVMYLLEETLRAAKGKLMVMDVCQIPKGMDVDKWIHYAELTKYAFINSKDEKNRGQNFAFNQFKEIDMTLSQSINQYIGILDKLDSLIEDITGISRQSLGDVTPSETVGGVQQAVMGTRAVTEMLFFVHNNVKVRAMEALLEEAKVCWPESKKAQFILDDMTRVVMDIDGALFNSAEYGIFVSNSQKDIRIKAIIENLAQSASQNGTKLHDIISVLSTESIAESIAILRRADEENAASAQQVEEAKYQSQKRLQDDKFAFEAEQNALDRQSKMDIAKVQALGFAENKDANANLVPDVFENEKLQLQADKLSSEKDLKTRQVDQKDRELDIKQKQAEDNKELAEKEMEIKRRQGTGI